MESNRCNCCEISGVPWAALLQPHRSLGHLQALQQDIADLEVSKAGEAGRLADLEAGSAQAVQRCEALKAEHSALDCEAAAEKVAHEALACHSRCRISCMV